MEIVCPETSSLLFPWSNSYRVKRYPKVLLLLKTESRRCFAVRQRGTCFVSHPLGAPQGMNEQHQPATTFPLALPDAETRSPTTTSSAHILHSQRHSTAGVGRDPGPPAPTTPAPCPQAPRPTSPQHPRGRGRHHHPGQPILMPDCPF